MGALRNPWVAGPRSRKDGERWAYDGYVKEVPQRKLTDLYENEPRKGRANQKRSPLTRKDQNKTAFSTGFEVKSMRNIVKESAQAATGPAASSIADFNKHCEVLSRVPSLPVALTDPTALNPTLLQAPTETILGLRPLTLVGKMAPTGTLLYPSKALNTPSWCSLVLPGSPHMGPAGFQRCHSEARGIRVTARLRASSQYGLSHSR